MSHTDRVVVLVDMDCFYCQVEERLDPKIAGKPIAVVQYNAWRGGGIIAVNYPARDRGVTRHMRGNEASKICPEIQLVKVPNVRGKADLTKYREAGKRVAEVLQTFTKVLERASVDEAYLDITEEVNQRLTSDRNKLTIADLQNTHVVGCETTEQFLTNIYHYEHDAEANLKLALGGALVEEIRAAVYEKTGYRCSAGIAHNKILAKLVCGMHKPNQQTILPHDGVTELYKDLPLRKIKSLGGKFGLELSDELKITKMSELAKFTEAELLKKFDEKNALWLYNIARGIDTEPVTIRLVSKSIGCCKRFPGKTALKSAKDVTHWLSELSLEISERLEQDLQENNRKAKQIIVSFAQEENKRDIHSSRTQALNSYETQKILADTFETLNKHTQKPDGTFCLKFLGLSAGKFEDCKKNLTDISTFFKSAPKTYTVPETSSKSKRPSDVTQFIGNMSNKKLDENEVLDIQAIEDDDSSVDFNPDEILKTSDSDDDFSNTTIELDLRDELENKLEFPSVSEENFEVNSRETSPVINSNNDDTSRSFFMKYAKKMNTPEKTETNLAILNDLYNEAIASSSKTQVETVTTNLSMDENSNSCDAFKQLCPECEKKIPVTDFMSHMDHHMAEKLMAEEKRHFQLEFQAHKPKLQITAAPAVKTPKSTKTTTKRKTNPVDNNASIKAFFSVQSTDKANYKECVECGKKISPEEFSSHLDYHTAKKLHLELNPVKTVVKVETKHFNSSNKKKNPSKNISSVSKFFKSTDK